MRGSLVHRGKNRWALVLDLGYIADPTTGKRTRKQKWIKFAGTKKEAGDKLTEVVRAANRNEFVEPSKLTVIEWLRTWLEKSVKPPMRRPETYRVYKSIIETHIAPSTLALIPLQRLRGTDMERYYADLPGAAPASLSVHHAILHRALKKAVKDQLLSVNPAIDLDRRRPTKDRSRGAREHCWSAIEARRFIETAKMATPQVAAYSFLALDSGARKAELNGFTWPDLDLDTATLTIARQLDKAGLEPVFGVTKTGCARTVTLGDETITQLRIHKRTQAVLRMRNRTTYKDFGLIFAKEPEDLQTPEAALGQPLTTLSGARFSRLAKRAGVKRIKFHGLRHTCATLLLGAGTPVQVVSQRLGHAKVSMTLDTYAHALPTMQHDAAARLGQLLHG